MYSQFMMHGQRNIKLCSETSAYKIQTPGNYPEESIQHSVQGESLKSRIVLYTLRSSQIFSLLAMLPKQRSGFKSFRRAPVHANTHTHTHVVTLV